MKIKTSELTGVTLDWAVATAEGWQEWDAGEPWEKGGFFAKDGDFSCALFISNYRPSSDWSQGGPIIEREITKVFRNLNGTYTAQVRHEIDHPLVSHKVLSGWTSGSGPTPLVAAMRCYVASKLGDEVDVPEELVKKAMDAET